MKAKSLVIGLLIFVFAPGAVAQSLRDSSSTGFLSIHTADSNSVAVIDTGLAFRLPIDSVRLAVGTHRLAVKSGREWNADLIDTVFWIDPARVCLVNIPRKYSYAILSDPSGAIVSLHGTPLGATPLRFTTDRPLTLPLALSLIHYQSTEVDAPAQPLIFTRLSPSETTERRRVFESFRSIRNYRQWVYGSIVTGIVSGSVSAIAKHRAENYQTSYEVTGDPAFHRKSNSYDTLAGSTLLLTEISFGFLSYLLLGQ